MWFSLRIFLLYRESISEEIDLFGGVIENLFNSSDSTNKGYITSEEFAGLLQSEQMIPYLTNEDIIEMHQYFSNIPGGRATYNDFYPLGRELILRVYRAKDPSEVDLHMCANKTNTIIEFCPFCCIV